MYVEIELRTEKQVARVYQRKPAGYSIQPGLRNEEHAHPLVTIRSCTSVRGKVGEEGDAKKGRDRNHGTRFRAVTWRRVPYLAGHGQGYTVKAKV